MRFVSLTPDGIDLAQKYKNWFSWLGLWGKEHKYNPILTIIISIITGIIGIFIGMLL